MNSSKVSFNFFTLTEHSDRDTHPYSELFKSKEEAVLEAKSKSTELDGVDSSIHLDIYEVSDKSKTDLMDELGYDLEEVDDYEIDDLIDEYISEVLTNSDYSNYYLDYEVVVDFSDYSDKQNDEARQLAEADDEKRDLIDDFEERFKDFIHYSESAGYNRVSYYAVLLLDSENNLVKNDTKLFDLTQSEYEKQDYVGTELVNLGSRIHREKTNLNPENAVIQIRISDHPQKHTNDINDASLSIPLMPEHELTSPNSQQGYEKRGVIYSTGSLGFDIHTEYIVAVNSESDNDSSVYVGMIRDWIDSLDYKELIENRKYDYYKQGGEASCSCKTTQKNKNMKVGDFIVHNSYEHSDDRFSVIKEITDMYVVFDSFEGSKNKGQTQAPISHLNNYRPSNSEELFYQKGHLKDDDEVEYNYETGGEVKKINYTWDKLPITFKVDESPNLRKINFNPKDDGLRLLFQNIVGKDELRPNMSGVFFDEEGVVSTDAHKLVYIPYGKEKPSYQGIFNMHDKKSEYTGVSLGKEIDAKYPNYKAVMPMDNKDYVTVDLAKLRIYANALTEGFSNKTTKQIHTLIGESVFGFKGEFLIQCIDVLMSLGHEYSDVYYSSPKRACVLVPKGGRMMKDLTVLVMPVFLQEISVDVNNVNNSGAEDIDFQYEFLGLYSFNENKILFRDKKYEIEKGISKKEAWGKYDISLEDFKEFKRIGTKNKRMYIEDFCLLKNGQLHQSDIYDSVYLIVDGVKLEGDGFYRYTDLGLLYDNRQNEKQDDYPLPYKTEENLEEFGVVEISDVEYFKENMKYASKVAMRDDLRPTVSQIFFETVENNLRIKSTDAHNLFSNRIDCLSDKNVEFILSSSINTAIFNILNDGFVIKIYTLEKNESTPFSDDLKIIEFKTLNKNIIIRSSNNRDNKILNNLKQFLQGDNVGLYTHELSVTKNKLKEMFSDFNKDESMGSSIQIKDVGGKFTMSKGEFNFDVNVKKTDIFTTKNGLFVMNPCSDGRICINSNNMGNFLKLLEKSEVRFIFDEKAKLNYLDSLKFEFDKKAGEKTTSPKSDTTKKAVKKTEPSVNKTETSNDKIIRFKAEIDGYNDLIELVKGDVLSGDIYKISGYKEMIEGLEMLIELEGGSTYADGGELDKYLSSHKEMFDDNAKTLTKKDIVDFIIFSKNLDNKYWVKDINTGYSYFIYKGYLRLNDGLGGIERTSIASSNILKDEHKFKIKEENLYDWEKESDPNKERVGWESIIYKFGEVYFSDGADGHELVSDQVKAEEYKWQFDRYSKYPSNLSWADAEDKFKKSLTADELSSIEISYKKEEYADLEEHDIEKYHKQIIVKLKKNTKDDISKEAVKKTEPSVNKTETSNDKIIRFKAEIDGYNDLIELAEDDVLSGATKIKAYKEIIEGLEMLIELEKDSNPNYETPIAVYKEVDSEKDRIKFIDYVLGFYGADGIYANDYKGGFSREQVEKAVEQYLNDPQTDWGMGDSADREIMRDKYLIPMLDSMEDVIEENEQEEKDMIQQKLLNKEWDIADDYNRNYMDKYGFYGSDKFLKNFPIIEDVLIKSDERIGKMFNAEDGNHEIIGKKLHPTGNLYDIKRLNTNAIYRIGEDKIDEWIDRMERTTTKEYKDEKEFEDKINFLKNDDNFTNDALDYILSEIPMGVIEEVYIQDSSRSGVKNLLKEFLKKNNIEVPDKYYLNNLVDGLKAKYYLRNKQEIIDVLGDKATPSVMNVLWGKKYRYTFDKMQLTLNRKQFIDLKLKDGYVVEDERPKRKLRNPTQNSYYSERDLTRAEFDYAEAKFSEIKQKNIEQINEEPNIESDNVELSISENELPQRDRKHSILDKEVNYSTRKMLNRADINMPKELAERISEEGITIEELDGLEVPVFKYKTQITIHGLFDLDEDKYRIGGYQSLILNQNKSLGVKYNAIDHNKKAKINNSIILKSELQKGERFWFTNFDSTGLTVTYKFSFDKDELQDSISKLKEMYNSIPNLFIGNKNAYVLNFLGRYFASIDLDIKAIYENNLFKLISFITDGFINSLESYEEKLQESKDKADKEIKERQLEWKKQDEEKERKINEIFIPQRDKLIEESPYEIIDDIPNSKTFKLAHIVQQDYAGFDAQISVTDFQVFGNKFKKIPFERVSSWSEIENNQLRTKSFRTDKKTITKEELKRLIDKRTKGGIPVFRVDVLQSENLDNKNKESEQKQENKQDAKEDFIVTFGKYKGKLFLSTPKSYQEWLLSQKWFKYPKS